MLFRAIWAEWTRLLSAAAVVAGMWQRSDNAEALALWLQTLDPSSQRQMVKTSEVTGENSLLVCNMNSNNKKAKGLQKTSVKIGYRQICKI